MGPVVSHDQLAPDGDYLSIAEKEGATVPVGGAQPTACARPTVLTGVEPRHRVAREEVFGPVAALRAPRRGRRA